MIATSRPGCGRFGSSNGSVSSLEKRGRDVGKLKWYECAKKKFILDEDSGISWITIQPYRSPECTVNPLTKSP